MSNSLDDGDREPLAEDTAQPDPAVTTEESATSENADAGGERETSEAETPPEKTEKPRQRASQRIGELVSARKALEAENARLYALLERGGKQEPAKGEGDPAPRQDQFEDYEQFIEAKAAHAARQEFAKQARQREVHEAQQRQQAEFSEREDRWNETHEAAIEEIPDYLTVFQKVGTSIGDAHALAIKSAEDPAALVYFLGKNPGELDKFRNLSGERLLMSVGRLEERIARQKAQKSNAPPPVNPIRGNAPASNALSDKLSTKEWFERRNKQLGR